MTDINIDIFNNSVKKILKSMNIKQYAFAEAIGMQPSLFTNKINRCKGRFNLTEILKIAEELAESVEDLATGNIKELAE